MKIRPKPLSPPCRAIRALAENHVYSSRADSEPEQPDPEAAIREKLREPVELGQRITTFTPDELQAALAAYPMTGEIPSGALGRDPLEEPVTIEERNWLARWLR